MKYSKPLSVLLSVLTALLVVTASVAVPLLFRPFYYAHIGPMELARYGLNEAQIKMAYNDMMDYCLGLRPDFAAGELWWSESGASHFADVRTLFLLDLGVLALSLVCLALLFLYCRKRDLRPYLFRGRGPGFWGAAGLGVLFVLIGALAAADFDRAFVVFHSIFFPGKTNWLFHWEEDPIILLLPQDFFMNCAILILALLLVWCLTLILTDLLAARLRKKRCQAAPHPGCNGNCSGCSGCQ